jgi:hypothetical protein
MSGYDSSVRLMFPEIVELNREEELREIRHVNVHGGVPLALDPIGPAKLDQAHNNQHESKQSLDCGTQIGVRRLDVRSMAKVVCFAELVLLVNKGVTPYFPW